MSALSTTSNVVSGSTPNFIFYLFEKARLHINLKAFISEIYLIEVQKVLLAGFAFDFCRQKFGVSNIVLAKTMSALGSFLDWIKKQKLKKNLFKIK